MLEFPEALRLLLDAIEPGPGESVPLDHAFRRVLRTDVSAKTDLPPFDNSAVDGFAVRSVDCASATEDKPRPLRNVGTIPAGATSEEMLKSGECQRIFTGAPLPPGADAVVMQEDTAVGEDEAILVKAAARPWENIRLRGEDIRSGFLLGETGRRLGAGDLAILVSGGLHEVEVGSRPRVRLLSTGNELIAPGEALRPGTIYESNTVLLRPFLDETGAIVESSSGIPDDETALEQTMRDAFDRADFVITTGGVSVGARDCVKEVFTRLGGTGVFWKIALKPGKPFYFGTLGKKYLFGLPGNPISALVTFLILVRPAMLKWQGATRLALPTREGILAERLTNPGVRRHFLRARIDAAGNISVAGTQASHRLRDIGQANCLLEIEGGQTWDAGTRISAQMCAPLAAEA
jgi:molybdopterin molybdotransferase